MIWIRWNNASRCHVHDLEQAKGGKMTELFLVAAKIKRIGARTSTSHNSSSWWEDGGTSVGSPCSLSGALQEIICYDRSSGSQRTHKTKIENEADCACICNGRVARHGGYNGARVDYIDLGRQATLQLCVSIKNHIRINITSKPQNESQSDTIWPI